MTFLSFDAFAAVLWSERRKQADSSSQFGRAWNRFRGIVSEGSLVRLAAG